MIEENTELTRVEEPATDAVPEQALAQADGGGDIADEAQDTGAVSDPPEESK